MQRIRSGNKTMQNLYNLIEQKTVPQHQEYVKQALSSMLSKEALIQPVTEELLVKTVRLDGEFQVVLMDYNDLAEELQTKALRHLIKSALGIVVQFEEDGSCFEKIKTFSEYIYDFTSQEQSLHVSVEKVDTLSKTPIKILFGGILPINQMQMYIGKGLYDVIASEPDFFQPLFNIVRKKITKQIGIPLLPLYPEIDENLKPYEAKLVDPIEDKIIAKFEVDSCNTKENIDKYLLKLYYIYQKLAKQLQQKS
ncbi:MAG: hypothetical protein GXO11_04465 [Epsilonproteobacteria bacterium]|nr:hypothetical protein [Campylobacterota bacterium]